MFPAAIASPFARAMRSWKSPCSARQWLLYVSLQETALSVVGGMIEVVKGIEPELGYGAILKISEVEAAMREGHTKRTKSRFAPIGGVGCSYDIWTKGRHILKVEPEHGPANGVSTCIKGKFWLGLMSIVQIVLPNRSSARARNFARATWDEASLTLVAHKFPRGSKPRTVPMRSHSSLPRSAPTRRAT